MLEGRGRVSVLLAVAAIVLPHGHSHKTLTEHVSYTPKSYARHKLRMRGEGWSWGCLRALWQRESRWRVHAHNASSGAHGIPQALPGWKMGPGWQSNFRVQIRWGLSYIHGRYGNACVALAHSNATNWY